MNVDFETDKGQNVSVNLYDRMDRILKKIMIAARKGSNNIKITTLKMLSAGSYIIEMIAGGQRVFKDLLLKK